MINYDRDYAIQISGLDDTVTEYTVSKVIKPYAKTNIELAYGTAILRDYS